MITCGEALEMVRKAMWEAGFPNPLTRLTRHAAAEFAIGLDPFEIVGSSPKELAAFYKACRLMYRAADPDEPLIECFECWVIYAPKGSCTHIEALA